jgi:TatD DNase family protein
MSLPLHDAHNHLHDARLAPHAPSIFATLAALPLTTSVVDGTCPDDWPAVEALAAAHPWVYPSYGLHPWHVNTRPADWRERLLDHLDRAGARVGVGEIGLDKWVSGHDLPAQIEAFVWQLRVAVARDLPVSIHCLQAWGTLAEILEREPVPTRGFLLHAYGGPRELVHRFVERGAYFSFSGYFLKPEKQARREVFREIPLERLLVETDAPDMAPPADAAPWHLPEPQDGRPINHPANIAWLHERLADLRGLPVAELASKVDAAFHRLFG